MENFAQTGVNKFGTNSTTFPLKTPAACAFWRRCISTWALFPGATPVRLRSALLIIPNREILDFYQELAEANILPKFRRYRATGYHGTMRSRAKAIINGQIFKPRSLSKIKAHIPGKDAFLGWGAYFFEDTLVNEKMVRGAMVAQAWATEKFDFPGVVKIQVSFERLFDLTAKANDAYLSAVQDWFYGQAVKSRWLRAAEDWCMIKFLCLTSPHLKNADGIRWNGFSVPGPLAHLQAGGFCVKKMTCLSDFCWQDEFDPF